MYANSTYIENKSIKEIRYIIKMVGLILLTINFGYKSQFYIRQKTLLGSLQFIGSLCLLYRTTTLKSSSYNREAGVFNYETKGSMIKKFMVSITILKMLIEVGFSKFYSNTTLLGFQNKYLKIFMFDLMNAKIYDPSFEDKVNSDISKRGMKVILITNLMDLTVIIFICLIDFWFKPKINFSHLTPMKEYLGLMLTPFKLFIHIFLMLEVSELKVNLISFIFLILLYFLMQIQIRTLAKQKKGGNERYIIITKWVIFYCFLLREIVIFLRRKHIFDIENVTEEDLSNKSAFYKFILNLLDSSLQGKYFRRFLVFFCCQYYSYFKELKHKIREIKTEIKIQELPNDSIYKGSFFKNEFLQFMVKIMENTVFYDEKKNTQARIDLLDKCFHKHKWISKFKIALGIKMTKDSIKGEEKKQKSQFEIKNILKKLSISILSIFIENLSTAIYFSLLLFCVKICYGEESEDIYKFSFKAFDLSLLIWSLFTFILPVKFSSDLFLIKFSLNFMYPLFLIGLFIGELVVFWRKQNKKVVDIESMKKIRELRIFIFGLMIFYNLVQIGKNSAKTLNTKYGRWYYKKKKKLKAEKSSLVNSVVEELIRAVVRFSRLIALVFAIYSSLVSIQIFNTLLLVLTLGLFWTTSKDRQYWSLYMYYNMLILVLM